MQIDKNEKENIKIVLQKSMAEACKMIDSLSKSMDSTDIVKQENAMMLSSQMMVHLHKFMNSWREKFEEKNKK